MASLAHSNWMSAVHRQMLCSVCIALGKFGSQSRGYDCEWSAQRHFCQCLSETSVIQSVSHQRETSASNGGLDTPSREASRVAGTSVTGGGFTATCLINLLFAKLEVSAIRMSHRRPGPGLPWTASIWKIRVRACFRVLHAACRHHPADVSPSPQSSPCRGWQCERSSGCPCKSVVHCV